MVNKKPKVGLSICTKCSGLLKYEQTLINNKLEFVYAECTKCYKKFINTKELKNNKSAQGKQNHDRQ